MSIATVPRGLQTLLSPLTGTVAALDERLLEPGDALLHASWCELPQPADGSPGSGLVQAGGGWSAVAASARAAALGEAVERRCAGTVDETRLVRATAAELGREALDPGRIRLFQPSQVEGTALVLPDRSTSLRWLRGVRLPDRQPAWLPAQLVHLAPLPAEADGGVDEPLLTLPTSNGLACGPTFERAALSALLELVERDAFTLTWAGRLSLPRLEWQGNAELEEFAATRLAPTGLRYAAIDLSPFLGVPVVLGVVSPPAGRPGPTAVGAAASATAAEATRRALAEAFAAFAAARAFVRTRGDRSFADDGSDLDAFDDRVLFYADPKRAGALAFLTACAERRHVGEVPRLAGSTPAGQLAELCARIAARGGTAYAADLTTVDVADAGLHVVRALCPELCPLDASQALRFLGVPRLLTGAHEAGLTSRPLLLEEVNSDPHPFP